MQGLKLIHASKGPQAFGASYVGMLWMGFKSFTKSVNVF